MNLPVSKQWGTPTFGTVANDECILKELMDRLVENMQLNLLEKVDSKINDHASYRQLLTLVAISGFYLVSQIASEVTKIYWK